MSTPLLLGCIADDFTGATDLANNLVRAGMRVLQINGLPSQPISDSVDAIVVALKSRTLPVQEAIDQSLQALRFLKSLHSQQIYFKYCSTFDSTPTGNIGPVTEALMKALNTDFTVATPAFPDNGRTVFKGHLFVGDVLLNESGMQNHPLTPMRDANLVRVLQAQCKGKVGLVDYRTTQQGSEAIKTGIQQLRQSGVNIAVIDAISNQDLYALGPAIKELPLVTAGSGVAIGLPANFGIDRATQASQLPAASGLRAIVSGSCSLATNKQVAQYLRQGLPAWAIDANQIGSQTDVAQEILEWAQPYLANGPVLIYSTASAATLQTIQSSIGTQRSSEWVEKTLASVAKGLVSRGVRQLIVAGGETSGACVQALGIEQMRIGPQIDPGVPWCYARSQYANEQGLHITLKSGNFGSDDFFTKSFEMLA
jgi:3-dehydrotetronate 4-kinase